MMNVFKDILEAISALALFGWLENLPKGKEQLFAAWIYNLTWQIFQDM